MTKIVMGNVAPLLEEIEKLKEQIEKLQERVSYLDFEIKNMKVVTEDDLWFKRW